MAGACGGADDEAADTTTTAASGSSSAPAEVAVPEVRENTEGYGQDATNPDLYRGAGGYELDTSECPGDWDPMEGITDSEINLFTALPLSGPIAAVGIYGHGMNAFFEYVNANGGIDGRDIKLEVNDNQYQPALTKTITDEALASGSFAGSVGINGTPMNLAIWDDMNRECVPALLAVSGAAEFGDVEGHPWTGPSLTFPYVAEASIQAGWLKDEFPDGAEVVTITINNDFGKQYLVGLKDGLEGSDIEVVKSLMHDPTAANLDNELTTAESTGAEVLVVQSAGAFCSQVLAGVERSSWDPIVILPNNCQTATVFQPLRDQGLTGEGAYVVQNGRTIDDPDAAELPFVQAYYDFLPTVDLDPEQTSYALGWETAWAATYILKTAATYEGGLNRANIILAARDVDTRLPLQFDGLTAKLSGATDAYLYEGGLVAQYEPGDDGEHGVFRPVSDLIDLEGQLGTFDSFADALASAP